MTPRLLAALALATGAFLLRGAFYCVLTPAWEGFDEWAHFARAQALASDGSTPLRSSPVQPEIGRSLSVLPLPRHSYQPPGSLAHDQFWTLPPSEREARRLTLFQPLSHAPPAPGALQYQAQQPPLYYLPMSLLLRAAASASLPARILLLRLATLCIAACSVPLCFLSARAAFSNHSTSLAASLAAASLPCLLIVTCRVSGDALFIALASTSLLFALLAARRGRRLHWALLGLALALALLTKATALALLALIPAAALARRTSPARPALAFALAALASPWYVATWLQTSTLSGEQTHAAVAAVSLSTRLHTAASLPWPRLADCAAFTHIWTGG